MTNPHLTSTGDPWTGSSTPTITRPSSMPDMLSWTGGQGQGSGSTTTNVVDTRGNDGRGDGQGDGQVTGVASIDSLTGPITNPTDLDDEIWALAVQAAASNPGYELSAEGQKLKAAGIMPGSDQWVMHFGLPQIVGTTSAGKPKLSTHDNKPIMTGQGKHLLDQYDDPTGSYQEQVDDYYEMREAEQAQQPDKDPNYGYGYGYSGGSSRGTGYFGGSTGFPQVASAHRMHQGWLDTLYKGRTQPGQEVQKMLASNQKVDAANILSGLSQGAQAFAMDPKTRGILTVLQA